VADVKTRVLFVCVHNAARSQMAEAFLRELGGDRFEVESAGFEPRPVSPLVVEAMRRVGLDISGATPKEVFDLYRRGRQFQLVISVCDQATAERCPIFPTMTQRLDWSFEDPSTFTGTEEERLAKVERLRDEIRLRIVEWLANPVA
jgi:arsenate reductase (thioredoxin)